MKAKNFAGLVLNSALIIGMVAISNGYASISPDNEIETTSTERVIVVEKTVYTSEPTAEMLMARDEFISNPNSGNYAEEYCLAQNIFFEAGIDNLAGMAAVANTVLNRVEHEDYPNSICGVIHQGERDANGNMVRNRCQFSWYCDGKTDRVPESENWERSKRVAWDILHTNEYRGLAEGATHYHATYVNPRWASHNDMNEIGRIGEHIFYRWDA